VKYKTAELGQVIRWQGKLATVISLCTGEKMVGIEMIESPKCECCGHPYQYQFDVAESSPLFQESAEPVKTINELRKDTK
jgi:hypothetical protein